jgi:hypothetical protein
MMERSMATYNDDRTQSQTALALQLSFAVSVLLSELAFLQSRAALGFVFILLTVLAAIFSIGSGLPMVWLVCAVIILSIAGLGIAEFIRASNKLREMTEFIQSLKLSIEQQVGRTDDKERGSDPARELLRMAEASRFSQRRG